MARRLLITNLYIALVITAGACASVNPIFQWQCEQPLRFVSYLAIALLASGLKISIPTITGTLSVGFLFHLIGVVELSLPEAMVLGWLTILMQCVWQAKTRASLKQIAFNLSSIGVTVWLCYIVEHASIWASLGLPKAFVLLLTATTYYFCNTVMVSTVIGLTEDRSPYEIWRSAHLWSYPYYLVGG